jgi:hypothetical protein
MTLSTFMCWNTSYIRSIFRTSDLLIVLILVFISYNLPAVSRSFVLEKSFCFWSLCRFFSLILFPFWKSVFKSYSWPERGVNICLLNNLRNVGLISLHITLIFINFLFSISLTFSYNLSRLLQVFRAVTTNLDISNRWKQYKLISNRSARCQQRAGQT